MSAVIQPKMFKKTTFSRVGIEQNQRLKDGSIKSGSTTAPENAGGILHHVAAG
jgi:hypothetical protein